MSTKAATEASRTAKKGKRSTCDNCGQTFYGVGEFDRHQKGTYDTERWCVLEDRTKYVYHRAKGKR